MANDYGIKISAPGYDARSATNLQLLLNMEYPIAKLDTTNIVSFQDILLTFVNDPPEPAVPGVTPATTLVYSFNHGYSYTPQVWSLINVVVPPPSSMPTYDVFNQEQALLSILTIVDYASLRIVTDATKVYFYVDKYQSGLPGGGPNPLGSCQVKIRVYVFVQDITS